MVVEDKLDTLADDDGQFFVVLFSANEEVKSSLLLKFQKVADEWDVERAKEFVSHPEDYQAKFVNGFRVSADQILLVTWYRTIVYNT